MASQRVSPPGPAGAPPRDVLQPALNTSILKYHSAPRARLVAHTELGLASAGVLGAALGRRDGDLITLTGCIVLAPYAREHLPPDLGGSFLGAARFGSPSTPSLRTPQSGASAHAPRDLIDVPAHAQRVPRDIFAHRGQTSPPDTRADPDALAAALAQAAASARDASAAASAAAAARERLASLRPRPGRLDVERDPTHAGTSDAPARPTPTPTLRRSSRALPRTRLTSLVPLASPKPAPTTMLPPSPRASTPHPHGRRPHAPARQGPTWTPPGSSSTLLPR